MVTADTPDVFHETERLTDQAERLRPCWDELLVLAHAVSERVREQFHKATGDLFDRLPTEESQFRSPGLSSSATSPERASPLTTTRACGQIYPCRVSDRLAMQSGPSDTHNDVRVFPMSHTNGQRRPLRVLVVEDYADAATALAALVNLWGHEAHVARDGPTALAAAQAAPPAAVLLDIGLPGMDGYEIARRLRELLPTRPLIVAVTGFGQDDDRRRSAQAGIDHHVLKADDPETIRGLLEAFARQPAV
jgi:CheY-like chemotaxis protein